MRLVVQCAGGGSHSMMLEGPTSVRQVKEALKTREGVPVFCQRLLFAGQALADEALLEEELQLHRYSLAHEVVLYMVPQLTAPRRVFLCGPPGGGSSTGRQARPQLELVESSSSLSRIMALLHVRGLTSGPFLDDDPTHEPAGAEPGGALTRGAGAGAPEPQAVPRSSSSSSSSSSNIVVKRADGSTLHGMQLIPTSSIGQVEQAAAGLGQDPSSHHLTFYQAPDGALILVRAPAGRQEHGSSSCGTSGGGSSTTTDAKATGTALRADVKAYTASRSALPQPVMMVRPPGPGAMPFSQLVRELAVVP